MAPLAPDSHRAGTIIFVDVDGVLNVGIRQHASTTSRSAWGCFGGSLSRTTAGLERTISTDQEDAPLLFSQASRDYALSQKDQSQPTAQDAEAVESLVSVAEHDLPSGGTTYSELAVGKGSLISPVLASHLADILRAAGNDTSVVLASNWRRLEHATRVRKLEAEVSKHLITDFNFRSKTRMETERGAADRLRFIGDYIEGVCGPEGKFHGRPLRVLVLEDFFVTPLDGWYCGRTKIDSVDAAEAYLLSRSSGSHVEVKLVHTYDEWRTPSGLRVQVGAGLSEHYAQQALAFLSGAISGASTRTGATKSGRVAQTAGLLTRLSMCLPCAL